MVGGHDGGGGDNDGARHLHTPTHVASYLLQEAGIINPLQQNKINK
ncbi:MAG: hypothetical protein ACI90V_008456 [Bacillariaceae sp.]|jgi:hypothetical protein